jgi:phosphate transport system substrate-binding protein
MKTFHHHARGRRLASLRVAFLACGILAPPALPAQAANVTLNETGSTLLYPVFQLWTADYARVAPNVSITAAATGSGAGISAAMSGAARIGASDAYMSDEQFQQNRSIANIPVAISAQTVNYNIPELNGLGLKLDGPALAGIYSGRITTWDAPEIAKLNPNLQLPHQAIVPIRRADASGDTFIFTQFLDFAMQSWEDKIGYGTDIEWPAVAGERTATGNDGMVQTIAATPYSVGYVGISFKDAIAKAGLGTAMLKNQSGKFLLPTPATVNAGASALDVRTPPDERLSLVFAPGDESYPLINYEYAVVSKQQTDAQTAAALRDFLLWSVSLQGGNAPQYLDKVGFIPLPDFVRAMSEKQINQIEPAANKGE